MNIQGGSGKSHSRTLAQDFEINLAPIVDCLTVLITFMLVSASFLSIGILDTTFGSAGEAAATQAPPVEVVQLEMQPGFAMEIKLSGQLNQTIQLPATQGTWDFEGLTRELGAFKAKWPTLESMVLTATNDIEYLHLIKCLEVTRKVLPAVVMGGF